ncbi:hypothetical protein [Noviherbaspirillum sp.]|uniref:hypothetical protein n=1 Tax=Noviherbaspirillum sp. TaxID=1926288 RepID=UPI002FE0A4BF
MRSGLSVDDGPVYRLALTEQPLLLGVFFTAGRAYSAVIGILYKNVPFLLWQAVLSRTRIDRTGIPSIRELTPDHEAKHQAWLHLVALAFLVAAAGISPDAFARPARACPVFPF